jgi:hypothetical protein
MIQVGLFGGGEWGGVSPLLYGDVLSEVTSTVPANGAQSVVS